MPQFVLLFILLLIPCLNIAQSRSTNSWVDFGSNNINKYLQFSSETMGPNALPVPAMNYAFLGTNTEIELATHYHQMKGDTAVNSFFRFYWNVAPGKVAIEIWGYPTETFHMGNDVRTQRQIYLDDTGWMTNAGDLWFSTYVQMTKGKKYAPDLVINYTFKTTTGINDHARYTDAPQHYFFLSLGKSFHLNSPILDEIRLAGMGGFYVWQTNMVESSQDEGPLFQAGLKLRKGAYILWNEFGGYSGYDAYRLRGPAGQNNNDPLILRSRIEREGTKFNWKMEYQVGFRNYHYKTFRLACVYHFNAKK